MTHLALAALLLAAPWSLTAQTGRATLRGHIHPKTLRATDRGMVKPSLALDYVTLVLQPSAAQQSALDQFLADQRNPASPSYHKWVTPEQFADRFGAAPSDIAKLQVWLESQNLTVKGVGRGRNFIAFSGTAAQTQRAFSVELHNYQLDGEQFFANATEPSLPATLKPLVGAIRGLDNFRLQPRARPLPVTPKFNGSGGAHYLAPDDFATIYNVAPLYAAGIDGTGQKIAVAGQTQIDLADVRKFRAAFNLSTTDPQVLLVPGSRDPGIRTNDLGEANLDVQWAGAVARNATLVYVYSNFVMDAVQHIIDQNLAPVLSLSYGSCEASNSTIAAQTLHSWAKQASAQGISWLTASGDSGGSDCSYSGSRSAGGFGVDMPASVPEVTGVGGTTFMEGTGTYWKTTADGNQASAMSYIPETAWNDDSSGDNPASSGGGASTIYSKPAWQTGPGVPSDDHRYVPDVALAASPNHVGYLVYSQGTRWAYGGTSAGAPSFAGIATLLNHYLVANKLQASPGVGSLNPRLYELAQATPGAFHDVTAGDNIIVVDCAATKARNCTAGSFGYKADFGYDPVSGLGSVDAFALVSAFNGGTVAPRLVITLSSSATNITPGSTITLTATVRSADGSSPTGAVTFLNGSTKLGDSDLAGSGDSAKATLIVKASQLAAGASAVTAQYNGASTSIALTVSNTAAAPVISSIANGASFTSRSAPGMILSIFGSQLADSAASATALPLPQQLGGVAVTIDGVNAPFYYASPTQLNVQIPYEMPTSGVRILKVATAGGSSTATFTASPVAPGIFNIPGSKGARGQYITLWATGLGAVTPAIATGAAPPASTPLANLPKPVQNATVTIGGTVAPIQFIGIPYGLAGVFQINVQVPAIAPLGTQSVVINIGGINSAAASLLVQ